MIRPHKYSMGGWVAPGMKCRLQRSDQGQDIEIPIGHFIVAPGHGVVIAHHSDAAFPNGFGNPYAEVRIDSGRFKGKHWYLGHGNSHVIGVGKHFHTGQPLVQLNNSLNKGWGWIEIGEWGPSGPYPNGHGNIYKHLFKPVWLWS